MQRELAYQILKDVMINNDYANLSLRRTLKDVPLIKRAFITELVYGVLRNFDLLLYQFTSLIKDNTQLKIKLILAMAAYEKYFLNQDPYVYVNEYVKLAHKNTKGFINATLRRLNAQMLYAKDEYINHSLPKWLYELLRKQYSKDDLDYFMTNLNKEPKVFYRLNPHKKLANPNDLSITMLDERMFIAKDNLVNTREFKDGYFYVQDYNSSFITDYLDLRADDSFLDLCSAPGSKLFNALEIVNKAYANDLYEHRLKLIKDKAQCLKVDDKITYLNLDASTIDDRYIECFDKILLDAPCSGLGVLKRKPDLKYHLKPTDLDDLIVLQKKILKTAYAYLKKGGTLVYSTCTLNTKENDRQIKDFILSHEDMKLLDDTIIRKRDDSDYFYVAKLVKKG